MNKLPINVITLPQERDRLTKFSYDCLLRQHAKFNVRQGEYIKEAPFSGCAMAHKKVIIDAIINNEEMVCIAEDDCVFSDVGAYDYFLENMPKSFDVYLGEIHDFYPKENNRVHDFCGLTLYVVHNRFYRQFLTMNDKNHLDRSLGKVAKNFEFYVCNPFVCRQSNGYSYMKNTFVNLDYLYKDREFFKSKVSI